LKGPEYRTVQHGSEVNPLVGAVPETHVERVRTDDIEPRDAMDGMAHGSPEWVDLDGRLARLQESPIVLQFLAVNLRPGFDEPLLWPGQAAAKTLERVQRERRGFSLVVRVKVWPLVRSTGFDEHPNHDSKEPRQLRH